MTEMEKTTANEERKKPSEVVPWRVFAMAEAFTSPGFVELAVTRADLMRSARIANAVRRALESERRADIVVALAFILCDMAAESGIYRHEESSTDSEGSSLDE